ncbi:DR_2398 family, partial [Durusdinium trenchii]
MPDRRGNNRIDSLRNIIRDPRVSLMFMIPGWNNVLRINGHAVISVDPAQLASFVMEGKEPRSVIEITIEEAYFQCARALMRADLWNTESQIAKGAWAVTAALAAKNSGTGFLMSAQASTTGLPEGYFVPAEDDPHERTFMQWPVNRTVHPDRWFLEDLQQTIAEIANTIAEFEPVVMLA